MNRDVLLGAGVVLAFIVLVSRAKKNQVTEPTGSGSGGSGVGGTILGFPPVGPLTVNNIVQPATPTTRPANQGQVITTVGKSDTTPTAAVTSSTQQKAIDTATNTGGIVPIAIGGSPTPFQTGTVQQISKADLAKGVSGGVVFKPFSGASIDAKFLGFVGSRPKFEFN